MKRSFLWASAVLGLGFFLIGLAVFYYFSTCCELVEPVVEPGDGSSQVVSENDGQPNQMSLPPGADPVDPAVLAAIPELDYDIESGMRVDYASNPHVLSYEAGLLTIAYENRATELSNIPSQKGLVRTSADGLNFSESRSLGMDEQLTKGVEFSDGTLHRYYANQSLVEVVSQTSIDGGESYTTDDGVRYELPQETAGGAWFGVWTTLVDEDDGVMILFNNNEMDESADGGANIYVSRLYSEDGLNFTMTDQEVLPELDGRLFELRDPNAIRLDDGRIRLIGMWQDIYSLPPSGRTGILYSFISDDNGRSFELEGEIVSWDDFTEFDVYSLNDPKVVVMDDVLRVYMAAMVPDASGESETGFKWILLSVSTEL